MTSAQPECVHREYGMMGTIPPNEIPCIGWGQTLLKRTRGSRASESARMRPKEVNDT